MQSAAEFDEDAVTRKLTAVRRQGGLLSAPRVQFGASIGVATFAAAILLLAGGDLVGTKSAASSIPSNATSAGPAVVVAAHPTEPVLASGTIELPDIRDDHDDDDGIIILDDEPESEGIVILDDPPVRLSRRAAGRARAREAAGNLMRRAETSRRAGDNATAKRQLAAALAASPGYAPAAAALAQIHIDQHNYVAAIRYAKRAARSAPDEPEYKLLLGAAHDLRRGSTRVR